MSASLTDLRGVGPATARLLTEAGFGSPASIVEADPFDLEALPGIGSVRAASLQAEARQLLDREPEPASADAAPVPPKKKATKKRKKRARKLRKEAKQLGKQARALTERAESTKSKKKRKRRLRAAAGLEAAARKALRKAEKLERR